MRTLGILISGRGSNMEAILDAVADGRIDARAGLVISNVPNAAGLERARERGVEAITIDHRGATREEHDRRMHEALSERGVDLVCLAGYMRLLSHWFIQTYPNAILNIHPSLLPAFPGLGAQGQALEYGVRLSGCTVHFVDEELDHGPIILQHAVPVDPSDTEETLSERILREEHLAYPEAVRLVAAGLVRIEGRVVVPVSAGD
ncbi:MAG TPA: phosphoribosylglycinamide formyltransferase [Blastocatellia bacterium]|nr:phosphoribosylglycinamide formyltransferase [Blastocatellia bacterium]